MAASSPSVFPPAIRLLGDLTVLGSARIECEVRGRVHVVEHLEVDPRAVVHGEIRSGSLRIVPGAEVKAQLAVGMAVRARPLPGFLRFLARRS